MVCLLGLVAEGRAQATTGPVAYPQATTTTSQGHVAPLGHDATRTFDEGRFQQLVPARYLPGIPTSIHAISVVGATFHSEIAYESLEIRLAHTTSEELGLDFDANLDGPELVASGPRTFDLRFDSWSRIGFDTPFVYDGSSSLVIEIRKRVRLDTNALGDPIVASRIASNPGRADLPAPRYASGRQGSGADRATRATHSLPTPMCLELEFEASTLTVRGDRGGAERNVFGLGTSFTLEVHATSGTHYAMLAFPGLVPGVATPPVEGLAYLPVAFALPVGGNPVTTPEIELTIANRAGLIGFRAAFQAAVLDFHTGTITWTNAVDLLINP